MNDDRYRWQDHVPATMNWRVYLTFGAVFAAFLLLAGVERAQTAEVLRQDAVTSIEATKLAARAPTDALDKLFVRHDAALRTAPRLYTPCAAERAV